jgi:hypothetical protein
VVVENEYLLCLVLPIGGCKDRTIIIDYFVQKTVNVECMVAGWRDVGGMTKKKVETGSLAVLFCR